ncbi:MAG: pitrilysin family protein [bacterium]|nr:pitrilysin family protein [bacterium]
MSSQSASKHKRHVLRNGVTVLEIDSPSTQAATVLVLVKTGSKHETRKESGLSHFLEHMFFKGTKKRPTPIAVSEPLDLVGGVFNAFTSEECTGYFAKVDRAHIKLAIDWVSDIFLHSTIPVREVEKEKGVIIEEQNMRRDAPMMHIESMWQRLLYGDQPAGWDIAGTKESIQAMSRNDLTSYMKEQYVASNTVVCIAGNLGRSGAAAQVKRAFRAVPSSSPRAKPEVVEFQTDPNVLSEYRKTDQTHIALGVRGYNLFHKDRFAQDLLAVILGGMMSSRLFIEIRERLGLAYYVSTQSDSNPDTGFVMTQAGVRNANAVKAVSAILKEYRRVAIRGVTAPELRKAKENTKGKLALALESSDRKATAFGLQQLLEGRTYSLQEMYDMIDSVRRSDIHRVASDVFRSENLNLAVLGPFKDSSEFQSILKL